MGNSYPQVFLRVPVGVQKDHDMYDCELTDFDSASMIVHGSVPDDITGSATEVILRNKGLIYRVLFDGGVHQSGKHNNWEHADKISGANCIVATHPHVDHVALIPRLLRDENTQHVFLPESAVHSTNIAIADTLRIVTKNHSSQTIGLEETRKEELNLVGNIEHVFQERGRFYNQPGKTRKSHKGRRDHAREKIESLEQELTTEWLGEQNEEGKWIFPKLSNRNRTPRDQIISDIAKLKALTNPNDEIEFYETRMDEFIGRMELLGIDLRSILDEYNKVYNEQFITTGMGHHEVEDIPTTNCKEDVHIRQGIFKIYRDMINQAHETRLGYTEKDCLITTQDVKTFRKKSVSIPENSEFTLGDYTAKLSFHKTGHLERGSCAARLQVRVKGIIISILVTGDIGRTDLPDYYPPVEVPAQKSDVIVEETTYGDENHIGFQESREAFFQQIDSAVQSGGHVFMPVLSQERAFRLFQDIKRAIQIGRLNVSDMKICYTGGQTLLNKYLQPFLHGEEGRAIKKIIHEAVDEDIQSMLKKSSKKTGNTCKILLASGGFVPPGSTANRMLVELIKSRAPIHIVSTNYHGEEGSPGHNLFHFRWFTDIYGADHDLPPNFKTAAIGGFSGHAGLNDLIAYNLEAGKDDSVTYLVHGETAPRESLQKNLIKNGREAHLPERGKEILLYGER